MDLDEDVDGVGAPPTLEPDDQDPRPDRRRPGACPGRPGPRDARVASHNYPEYRRQGLARGAGEVTRRPPGYAPVDPSRILQTRPPMRDFTRAWVRRGGSAGALGSRDAGLPGPETYEDSQGRLHARLSLSLDSLCVALRDITNTAREAQILSAAPDPAATSDLPRPGGGARPEQRDVRCVLVDSGAQAHTFNGKYALTDGVRPTGEFGRPTGQLPNKASAFHARCGKNRFSIAKKGAARARKFLVAGP
jgi:hypothetical protein